MVFSVKRAGEPTSASCFVPVALILGVNGKPNQVRVLRRERSTDRFEHISTTYCIRHSKVAQVYHAYKWMPIISMDGEVLRGGIVVVDFRCLDKRAEFGKGKDTEYISSLSVVCYSEDKGVFNLSLNELCLMVAEDIKFNTVRFVNLDYSHLLKCVKERTLSACVKVNIEDDYALTNVSDYEDSLLSLAAFQSVWSVKQTFVDLIAGDPNVEFIRYALPENAQMNSGTLWIPTSVSSPWLQLGISQKIPYNIVFPRSVVNWGVTWDVQTSMLVDLPSIQVPENVLGSTYFAFGANTRDSFLLVPYNSNHTTHINIENRALRSCYIKDTAKSHYGSALSKIKIRIGDMRGSVLERVIVDVNMASHITLEIPITVKEVYLLDSNPSGMPCKNWRSVFFRHFADSHSPCCIYASSRIYLYLRSRYEINENLCSIYNGNAENLLNEVSSGS